ncbi:MAG TPA: hypothetical protein VF457_12595 [Burkholderiaceae bacterium]
MSNVNGAPQGTGGSGDAETMERAAQELCWLQEIIARHEKHAFTVNALLAALLGGLATLVFSLKLSLGTPELALLGVPSVLMFGIWSSAHKTLCSRAIERAGAVEKFLRGETPAYDGPRVGLSLMSPRARAAELAGAGSAGSAHWWRAFTHSTNVIPWLIAVGVALVLLWANARRHEPQDLERLDLSAGAAQIQGRFGDRDCVLALTAQPAASGTPAGWMVKELRCEPSSASTAGAVR